MSQSTYVPSLDEERIDNQRQRVWAAMGTAWRTLEEVAFKTGVPEASVSARLRDLRRPEYGAHAVERRRRGDPKRGLHEYRVLGAGTHVAPETVEKPSPSEMGVALAHIRSLMECQKIQLAGSGGYRPPPEMAKLGKWLVDMVRRDDS